MVMKKANDSRGGDKEVRMMFGSEVVEVYKLLLRTLIYGSDGHVRREFSCSMNVERCAGIHGTWKLKLTILPKFTHQQLHTVIATDGLMASQMAR